MSFEMRPITELVDFNPKRAIKKGTVAPFIDMAALPVLSRDVEEITEKEFKSGGAKFCNGDTLFARITPCLENGKTAKVSGLERNQNGFGSTEFIVMSAKDREHDEDYVYYLARLPEFRAYAKARMEGTSGRQRVPWQSLAEFEYPMPSKEQRKRAGDFFRAIDNKISLNTKTNKTLEQMAQAIFKSWFVDFDPVKAKMNGEQPEGMDEATASLFPEKLDSETGIPVGWSQGVIADIAKLNAKSWTKKNQPEQVHYVDLANTKNGVIETVTSYDFSEAPSRARRILNSGDTIVGTVRPGNRSFAFIGDTEQPLTGSTGFAVLSPKEECWTSFVYLATTNDDSIDEYARLADGGAYPAIKPVVVADNPCAIPTKDIAQKFWQLTGSMLKKAHQNRLENEELAKLRDTLLPKLLSGEIELKASA